MSLPEMIEVPGASELYDALELKPPYVSAVTFPGCKDPGLLHGDPLSPMHLMIADPDGILVFSWTREHCYMRPLNQAWLKQAQGWMAAILAWRRGQTVFVRLPDPVPDPE